MLGAIAGDVIGSIYEFANIKTEDFALFGEGCRFTDDTVCTVAVAHCLLSDGDFGEYLSQYFLRHPNRGFGAFQQLHQHSFGAITTHMTQQKGSPFGDLGVLPAIAK